MPASLQHRDRQPELMDQPGLDERQHRQALGGLSRVNWLSRTSGMLWRRVQQLVWERGLSSLRVLDVACGGGDVGIGLARAAHRTGLTLQLTGCDISTVAIQCAREQARRRQVDAEFLEMDVLGSPLPDRFDVVICSLFLHHLAEPDAVRLLHGMAQAAKHLVLADDLLRSRVAYALAWLGCRVLSRSPIVRIDGPLSVRAAFTVPEVTAMAREAGLEGATLRRHWPQRFLLSWSRP
jgi:2-polyprenyl-3-methyl-5-hydroxy-6-metoxy-1,4-benzoquinol methylase